MTKSETWQFETIGTIESCYGEKFAAPRQPGLVNAARATLRLHGDAAQQACVQGLSEFSHLWVCFVFHQTAGQWQPSVRPPRLGGNERVGVFASRSNFRPNPIGWSVVEMGSIENGTIELIGGDFVDGTPVLDIKPYLSYVDAIADARCSYAAEAPQANLSVQLDVDVADAGLRELIVQTLRFDVRPAYRRNEAEERVYGALLAQHNVRWIVQGAVAHVVEVSAA